jgi:uridylate kinase
MMFVLSLGGSIVSPPEGPDVPFLVALHTRLVSWLAEYEERKLILVTGGGGPARTYQAALKECNAACGLAPPDNAALDRIGIAATRINAQLVKGILGEYCADPVVEDPSGPIEFTGKVLVASGWKPGFSSDFDAVYLGERYGASTVLNLSNIAKVYTADPKIDPKAIPLDSISWKEFRSMVGTVWTPGSNLPFDPIASAQAEAAGMRVICAAGKDLDNVFKILDGKPFIGTIIG